MRILQVIAYFNPKFGGDVSVCSNLSKQLSERGHQITILTTDFGFDEKYSKEIEDHGVHVVHCKTLVNFGLFIYSPSIKVWLKENIRNFDVIHTHNFRSYQNNCIYQFARKSDIPLVIQAHGSVLPLLEKKELKKLYDAVWGAQLLKYASGFIAVSKKEKQQYLKTGIPGNKITIIPNSIDISEFDTLPDRGIFRENYGIGPDEKIILYLGRLHTSKGINFLVEGFSNLLAINKNIKLVIAGPDDGLKSDLVRQVKKLKIEDSVIFPGPLYKNEKLEAIVDANILAYLGTIEIFGLVPFEALLCGTPVIVADDSGCGEIVRERQCGSVVRYGDIQGLVREIATILDDPGAAKKNIHRGQQFIKECITKESVLSKFEDLYENCIKSGNKIDI
jgi:glycosyltransferase involved in cell wall biosynthesis